MRKIGILSIVMILFCVNIPYVPAQQTGQSTIYVDDDNTSGPWDGSIEYPYRTIQDGINESVDEDIVFVFNGTYYETINITKTIHLLGENRLSTVIDGQQISNVLTVNSDGVEISNFTIVNSGVNWMDVGIFIGQNQKNTMIFNNIIQSNNVGVYVGGAYNTTIRNNEISNNWQHGIEISKWEYDGDAYTLSVNTSIYENTISYNSDRGIFILDETENTVITNNNIESNGGDGISMIDDTVVAYNKIIKNGGYGISCALRNHSIIGNRFFNDGLDIYSGEHDAETYKNNEITNNTINGKPLVYFQGISDKDIKGEVGQIIIINCKNITIHDTEINNTDSGIILRYSETCSIQQNKLESLNYSCLLVMDCKKTTINSNDFHNSDVGVELWNSEEIVISYNSLKENRYGVLLTGTHDSEMNNNTIIGNEIGILLDSYPYSPTCNNDAIKFNNFMNNTLGISVSGGQYTKVNYNNFIHNIHHLTFFNPRTKDFNYNYWDHLRYLPKVIFGTTFSYFFPIPCISFDWHPAQTPYDIGDGI